MKCSPFSRSFRKRGRHMHHHRGKFIKYFMRRGMDGYDYSNSDDECQRNQQIKSGSDMQHRIGHHGMKSHQKHDFGMKHCRSMIHRRKHGHGIKHRRHGHDFKHGMVHDHSMKLCLKKHGMRQGHFMEHRMKCLHGMNHKMHHGLKIGHGPGMHFKSRQEFQNSLSCNQDEERSLEAETGNMNENSDSEAFTFYKPKTIAQVMNESNKFQISLDTSYYQLEEVSLKIVDGKIDVSAMHECMEDNVYEFHEMHRSFDIPENVNPEVIEAHLDSDGKLVIEAACNNQGESSLNERDVPVIQVS